MSEPKAVLPGESQIELPLMPLREVVVFPHSIMPLSVGRGASIRAIEESSNSFNKRILLVAQRRPDQENPGLSDLYSLGCIAKILQILRLPDGTSRVLFEGLQRARLVRLERTVSIKALPGVAADHYYIVLTAPVEEQERKSIEASAAIQATLEAMEEYAKLNKKIPAETLHTLAGIKVPGRMADMAAACLKADYKQKQEALEILDPQERLLRVYELIQNEITVADMERVIKDRVKGQMEHNQREYYLNEQIKA
ncbi:MAG: LON peptidase substrate-binding domain-containing protein, partial [Deltaproteobacteria bacterium]|nr:LON peptidase substrate-binding domain-containing protein [Deltaproteobacteria bacterium]